MKRALMRPVRLPFIVLSIAVACYIIYFSYLTIFRYQSLNASYFDLGIMHQTVYNTYKAMKTGDWSRFLELTNPHGFEQVKRMAIHNDVLLALLAPFYFIFSGVETLLVIQASMTGLGAYAVYGIARHVFSRNKKAEWIGLLFGLSYLLYPPLQRATIFDFHPVTLATPLLLWMYYAYVKRWYLLSFSLALISLLAKEQVALTVIFFALSVSVFPRLLSFFRMKKNSTTESKPVPVWYWLGLIMISLFWFIVSMRLIIPFFRQEGHFALGYYEQGNIGKLLSNFFHGDTLRYFWYLLGPLGFLSVFAPQQLFITIPEFAVNLLSSNWNMRNIIYHYTSVLTPFIFTSSLYGAANVIEWAHNLWSGKKDEIVQTGIGGIVVLGTIFFAATKGPLPFSQEAELFLFYPPRNETTTAQYWKEQLSDKSLRIAATGHIAPLFASRRYLYEFGPRYDLADYIVLSTHEVYNGWQSAKSIPAYERLATDSAFIKVFEKNMIEVYKKANKK